MLPQVKAIDGGNRLKSLDRQIAPSENPKLVFRLRMDRGRDDDEAGSQAECDFHVSLQFNGRKLVVGGGRRRGAEDLFRPRSTASRTALKLRATSVTDRVFTGTASD